MIRNIDEKTTWASDSGNIKIRKLVYDSDPITPIGVITPFLSGYFTNNANGTYTAVAQTLPASWKVCDGSALNDAESLIFNGAGRYLPNLTDSRFIMGSTIALSGVIGGNANNQFSLAETNLPAHAHTIAHTHTFSGTSAGQSVDHTHTIGTGANYYGTGSAQRSDTSAYAEYTSGVASVDHTHTYSGTTSASSSANSGSVGSGTAFSILPKYLTCAYIMKIK